MQFSDGLPMNFVLILQEWVTFFLFVVGKLRKHAWNINTSLRCLTDIKTMGLWMHTHSELQQKIWQKSYKLITHKHHCICRWMTSKTDFISEIVKQDSKNQSDRSFPSKYMQKKHHDLSLTLWLHRMKVKKMNPVREFTLHLIFWHHLPLSLPPPISLSLSSPSPSLSLSISL